MSCQILSDSFKYGDIWLAQAKCEMEGMSNWVARVGERDGVIGQENLKLEGSGMDGVPFFKKIYHFCLKPRTQNPKS